MSTGSNKLSKEEFESIKSISGIADGEINKILQSISNATPKNKLNKDEFFQVYIPMRESWEPPVDERILNYVFKVFDLDGDGFVSIYEFVLFQAVWSTQDEDKIIEHVLRRFDNGNKGYISFDDLKEFVKISGEIGAAIYGFTEEDENNEKEKEKEKVDYDKMTNEIFDSFETTTPKQLTIAEFIKLINDRRMLGGFIFMPFQ